MSNEAFSAQEDYRETGVFAHLGFENPDVGEGWMTGYLDLKPFHLNRQGFVHGGIIATLIDWAACGAGLYTPEGAPKRYGITLSLTVNYIGAVRSGRLIVEGRQVSGGRRTYTAEAKVFEDSRVLLAAGIGTFQWRPGSEPQTASSSS